MLAYALARRLAANVTGLTFTTGAVGGNVFIARMPSTPDVAVGVFPTGGAQQPTLDPSDAPTVQIRVRGPERVARPGYELARAIYADLTALDLTTLDPGGPDEVRVISCTPIQSDPVPLGMDANERHEWVINLQLHVHAPTTHRPATPAATTP